MSSSGKIVNLVNPDYPQDAATRSYVDTSIPIGGIIMWSGRVLLYQATGSCAMGRRMVL